MFPPPDRRLAPSFLLLQLAFAGLAAAAVGWQVLQAPTAPDFSTIWAAQHVATPYDPQSITRLLGASGHLFSYPPTMLLLTWPLKLLRYEPAYLIWLVLSVGALMAALRSLYAPVLLAAPAVFLAAINGQTSLFMAALLLGAATLKGRPWLAGALYGVAASLKPQIGLLIPVYLIFAGHWRTIAAATATALAVAVGATFVYGLDAWTAWAGSLSTFLAANQTVWSHRYLSLPGHWRLAALAVGAVSAAVAARRKDSELGIFICVGAGLLGSLHAMDYDQAVLAAFAFSYACRSGLYGAPFFALLAFLPGRWSTLALTLLACAALAASFRSRNGPTPA